MTSLYKSDDTQLLSVKLKSIKDELEAKRNECLEPTLEEKKSILKVASKYLQEKKRKIYGGFGLNLLILDKNPNDAIYNENSAPDIDVYSPEPIIDLIAICNDLQDHGFKYVQGREATHEESYTVFVNFEKFIDITYVPRQIYNKIPYKVVNDYTVVASEFVSIDYLRMFTDPLISYWRLLQDDGKAFKRFCLLQKYYPFKEVKSSMDVPSTPMLEIALNDINEFLFDRKSCITVGFYAYNYFLNESNNKSTYKITNVPWYEFISTDYRNDVLELLDKLKKNSNLDNTKITYTEFYPFFQFTGYNVEIFYDGDMIAKIFSSNKKCIQYIDVPAIKFTKNESKKIKNSTIRIGTFHLTLLYILIYIMRLRVLDDNEMQNIYYAMLSRVIDCRNYYLKSNKKTFLDDSIFKEFIVSCVGDTIDPARLQRLKIASKKGKGKPLTYSYDPQSNRKDPETNWIFANTSGNEINNPKNLRLTLGTNAKLDADDEEEEEENNVELSKKSKKVSAFEGKN